MVVGEAEGIRGRRGGWVQEQNLAALQQYDALLRKRLRGEGVQGEKNLQGEKINAQHAREAKAVESVRC